MIRWTNMRVPGLTVMHCQAERGDVITASPPPGWSRSVSPYFTLYEEGESRHSMGAGKDPVVLSAPRTNVAALDEPPDVEEIHREIISKRYRFYCVSDPQKRKLEVSELALLPGVSHFIQKGYCLLFIGDAEVNGAAMHGGFIDAVDNDAVITASGNVLGLYIKRLQ